MSDSLSCVVSPAYDPQYLQHTLCKSSIIYLFISKLRFLTTLQVSELTFFLFHWRED